VQKPQLDLMMLTVIRLIIQVTTHFSSIIVRPQKIFQSDFSSFWTLLVVLKWKLMQKNVRHFFLMKNEIVLKGN
jgi:hypothetical protein